MRYTVYVTPNCFVYNKSDGSITPQVFVMMQQNKGWLWYHLSAGDIPVCISFFTSMHGTVYFHPAKIQDLHNLMLHIIIIQILHLFSTVHETEVNVDANEWYISRMSVSLKVKMME